jgi:hypothetical protein
MTKIIGPGFDAGSDGHHSSMPQRLLIQRAAAERILGARQETFFPLLDLCHGQSVLESFLVGD